MLCLYSFALSFWVVVFDCDVMLGYFVWIIFLLVVIDFNCWVCRGVDLARCLFVIVSGLF